MESVNYLQGKGKTESSQMGFRTSFCKLASKQIIAGISILVLSVSLAFYAAPSLFRQTPSSSSTNPSSTGSPRHHFSVRWMGFSPNYNNSYPDYYVAVNDAEPNPLVLQIALQIKNQENSSYYFRIEQYSAPPSGWTVDPLDIGLINVDQTKDFTYTVLRSRPTSIPSGIITEPINLVVKAFYDIYGTLYSQDNFNVTYHFLDVSASSWAFLDHDNFDDGSVQGWSAGGICHYYYAPGDAPPSLVISTDYYRSFPYSTQLGCIRADNANRINGATIFYEKNFTVPAIYHEAYLVYSLRSPDLSTEAVYFDGLKSFEPDVSPIPNNWYQVAIPLKVSHGTFAVSMTAVRIQFEVSGSNVSAYLDDVFVVAK